GRRDPGPGPAADGGSGARRQAVPAAERDPGDLRYRPPSGRSRRAAHGAAGLAGPRRPGAGSCCHAAHVNLQMPTLQWVAVVYCRKPVRERIDDNAKVITMAVTCRGRLRVTGDDFD